MSVEYQRIDVRTCVDVVIKVLWFVVIKVLKNYSVVWSFQILIFFLLKKFEQKSMRFPLIRGFIFAIVYILSIDSVMPNFIHTQQWYTSLIKYPNMEVNIGLKKRKNKQKKTVFTWIFWNEMIAMRFCGLWFHLWYDDTSIIYLFNL